MILQSALHQKTFVWRAESTKAVGKNVAILRNLIHLQPKPKFDILPFVDDGIGPDFSIDIRQHVPPCKTIDDRMTLESDSSQLLSLKIVMFWLLNRID
jgi:hypothetical protein